MNNQNRIRARQFLMQFFNDEELNNICFDYFPQVYNEFTTGMLKGAKVRLLVESCGQRGRMVDLLAAMRRERPTAYNTHFSAKPPAPTPEIKPITRNPRQIFLSHASQDADFARRLAQSLRDQGWEIWMAPDSIHSGEKWVEAINRGLAESGVFVLVLTEAAVNSRWVTSETNTAIGMEHRGELRFIPLEMETVNTPPLWQSYQWLPFHLDHETGLAKLLHELDSKANRQTAPQKPTPLPRKEIVQPVSEPVRTVKSPQPRQPTSPRTSKPLLQRVVFWLQGLPLIAWAGGLGFLAVVLVSFWPDGNPEPAVTPTDVIVTRVSASNTAIPTQESVVVNSGTPTMELLTQTPVPAIATPTMTATAAPTADPNVPPVDAELGDTWTRLKDGMVMVYVPPPDTPFVLESNVDAPTEGYWIDKYEVSNAQYQLCVDAGVCEPSSRADDTDLNGAEYPVVGVSAFDADAYSEWVGGTLPTEAEWEYAAVGDSGFAYPWGNEFDLSLLNCVQGYCNDDYPYTAPVDSFPDGASWAGAFNMAGNVWEWTASWWDETEDSRVVRGGSWSSLQFTTRSADRSGPHPAGRDDDFGFRVVIRVSPLPLTETLTPLLATKTPTVIDRPPTAVPLTAVVTSEVGVWLHGTPRVESEQLEWVLGGTVLTILSGQQTADEFEWQQVRSPSGIEGWVAVDYIEFNE